jgi:hypothetical protein
VKFYGSRFCQRCGKLFQLSAPDGLLCPSCEQSPAATAPAPAPVAVQPRRGTRKREPRPKRTAAGRNSGPVAGQRTLPMLRALAEHPAGLTTPQLAELASSATSWVNALGSARQLMLKQQRQGRVVQAGTAAGDRTRESALWRITDEGRRHVAGRAPEISQ